MKLTERKKMILIHIADPGTGGDPVAAVYDRKIRLSLCR